MATWRRPGLSSDGEPHTTYVGTRGSALARVQTDSVMDQLQARHPAISLQTRIVRTTGDDRTDVPLSEIGGKGLFVKELDTALRHGEVQMAVHSLKDLPAKMGVGLMLGAVPKREDPRDAWIHRDGASLADAPPGTRVGTSSLRRVALLRQLRSDFEIVPLRGNVDTRLRKMKEGEVDAIVLAAAGLNRLGRGDVVTELLDPEVFVPAGGQGCVAVTVREKDAYTRTLVRGLNHPASRVAADAERAFLEIVEGDCRIPVACHAVVDEGAIRVIALVATPDGAEIARVEKEGFSSMCEEVGRELAQELLAAGGKEILEKIRAG